MVIEEFMTGREVSVLSYVDGRTIKTMTSAQDHKRAKDGDQGLNTGGMGTFSPSPFYTAEVDKYCQEHIYQATVDGSRGQAISGDYLLWPDADAKRTKSARIQCQIRRPGGAGRASPHEK